MFSGLVRQFAKVRFYRNQILCLESDLNPQIGDSIAVNGACLTAIESTKTHFSVELSKESASLIATENLQGLVHVEPALRLHDGLHGHIVQGHIDCVGVIKSIEMQTNSYVFCIETTQKALECMVEKGSVCIDGISLTIHDVGSSSFSLVIIPHTMQNTLFAGYTIGRRVNIETDIIARSIVNMFHKYMLTHNNPNKKQVIQDIYDSIALSY
ncbi:riboflavin synthase [Helicobacter trogontum]|uniref:Riboflavin synthase n=1 Tax=Helicobacter trogontum TaxID=50960 RepID=A0A4U8TGZ2_9HELI|nr:riboflavin synthase [Helicobacter trogontum]TLD99333.1 riboflavin synthase [Helicobacter trogontum]